MIEGLDEAHRVLIQAILRPAVGSTIQPTGFPDLGPAEFQRPGPDGQDSDNLLVESVQSLANHMEAVGWSDADQAPVETLARLPYIEVRDDSGRFLTSSRLEPHRLSGAYVRTATTEDGTEVSDLLTARLRLEKGIPTDWRAVYASVFDLDPLSLLHGVFFAGPTWKDFGNPKIRRAVTAVMEAHDVSPVVSGGVKRDDVNPTVGENRNATEGYGFVPFGRTEYTAREIVLDVAIDVDQIRGYGLPEDATKLLVDVALWEVRNLVDKPLRLRTACDLELDGPVTVRRPDDWELPSLDLLAEAISSSSPSFSHEGALTVTKS